MLHDMIKKLEVVNVNSKIIAYINVYFNIYRLTQLMD
jgi:hypothetical protein